MITHRCAELLDFAEGPGFGVGGCFLGEQVTGTLHQCDDVATQGSLIDKLLDDHRERGQG